MVQRTRRDSSLTSLAYVSLPFIVSMTWQLSSSRALWKLDSTATRSETAPLETRALPRITQTHCRWKIYTRNEPAPIGNLIKYLAVLGTYMSLVGVDEVVTDQVPSRYLYAVWIPLGHCAAR